MKLKNILVITIVLFICSAINASAGSVTIPTTFTSGTTAKASEVNANFTAVKTAVDDNDSRIATLEAALTALTTRVTALETENAKLTTENTDLTTRLEEVEGNSVLELDGYLSLGADTVNSVTYAKAVFSGINVQVVSGSGTTGGTINGLGNLIVGYNQQRTSDNVRTGSHNIIGGAYNNYSSYGGLIFGAQNLISGVYASVSGGQHNTASGVYASVSGGQYNTASGNHTSVTGGASNEAFGSYSSILGGANNYTSGIYAVVVGGGDKDTDNTNKATGMYSVILGGSGNTVSTPSKILPAASDF